MNLILAIPDSSNLILSYCNYHNLIILHAFEIAKG